MPQRPPERLYDFARRLLWREAEIAGQGEIAVGFESACRSLHDRLAPLISSSGFHTLLARSLRLAVRDAPFLAGVRISANDDCALSGLGGAVEPRDPAEVADGLTMVLAHFMWLLVIFIGENLGLGKVREIWPEVPFDSVNTSSGAGK